jgi:predicted transcriptional regulator
LQSLTTNGRSHLQVVSEILYVCSVPKTKIQILEETGLSMRHLHFCLKQLLKQNMVRHHYRKKTYVTTEKGLRIIQQFPQDY